ncbi:MAG: prepilin peptidase [Lawsonibacter sp.]
MPACLLALLPLAGAAWQDWRTRQIPDWLVVFLAACGILRITLYGASLWAGLSGLLLLGLPLLACGLCSPTSMGGGDIKLCAALGFLLGPLMGGVLLLAALLAGTIYGAIRRENRVPLAPFLLPFYILILGLELTTC